MIKTEGLSTEQRLARSQHAKNLQDDELLTDILNEMEDRWLRAIANSVPEAAEKRELAYTMLYGIKQFRAELTAAINDAYVIESREVSDGD